MDQQRAARGAAAIVGSRGFIGRALADQLRRDGAEVLGFDQGDLDPPGALARLAAARTIYWAASTINPALAANHPERVEADRAAFRAVLAELGTLGFAGRLVFFSSGGTVYGAGQPPFTEQSPTEPTSAYGRAKLALEQDVQHWSRRAVIVRISNAYGPGQKPAPGQGVISHWLTALAARVPIDVIGDLAAVRDYVYIDDLVDGLARIHRAAAGEQSLPPVLNLASGVPTTLGEVLVAVEDVADAHDPVINREPARAFDLANVWLDNSLARRTLGWSPATTLPAGVGATWAWLVGQQAGGSGMIPQPGA